jgi:hypothetical protein
VEQVARFIDHDIKRRIPAGAVPPPVRDEAREALARLSV